MNSIAIMCLTKAMPQVESAFRLENMFFDMKTCRHVFCFNGKEREI